MPELYPEPFDEAELAEYAAWAEELNCAAADTLPHHFELSDEAQTLKNEVATTVDAMMIHYESNEVRHKLYTEPGGEMEVLGKIQAYQLNMLPQIYKDVRYESPSLQFHTTQETEHCCQTTCVQNALSAFGVELSQSEIAQAAGISLQVPPFPGQLMDFVRAQGFVVEEAKSVMAMIDDLIDGRKTIIHLGQPFFPVEHAILVSGVRIDNGTIEFIVNDPNRSQSEVVSLANIMPWINPTQYRKLSPTYSIGSQ